MSLRTRSLAALTALSAAAALAVVVAPAAHAAGVKIIYDAVGSTVVAKPNSTVALGPSEFHAKIQGDGSFAGTLPLPPTTSSFAVLGLLPATATVSFVPKGRATGKLVASGTHITVTSKVRYYIKLSDVTVAGLPAFVGSSCQTADPVLIKVSGPFNVTNGGTLTGKYAIGDFANCGLTTGLINLLIPGPGNTVSLTLSNGHAG